MSFLWLKLQEICPGRGQAIILSSRRPQNHSTQVIPPCHAINTSAIISQLSTSRLLIPTTTCSRLGTPDSTTADTSISPKLAASRRRRESSCMLGFGPRPQCFVGWTCSMRGFAAWLWCVEVGGEMLGQTKNPSSSQERNAALRGKKGKITREL